MRKIREVWDNWEACIIVLFLVASVLGAAILLPGCDIFNQGLLSLPEPVVSTPIVPNQLELYFPRVGQDPANKLVSLYGSCSSTLDIAIYSLTYPPIVKAIGDAKKRGVAVRVITDKQQAGGKSQTVAIDDLLLLDIPVKVDTHTGLMHLKMSVGDGLWATTGSYNYSAAATDSNDEMLVVITEPEFVRKCQKEFNRLWADVGGFENKEMSY